MKRKQWLALGLAVAMTVTLAPGITASAEEADALQTETVSEEDADEQEEALVDDLGGGKTGK